MAVCQQCGKGTQFGRNKSHSQVRTPRTYKANIQQYRLLVDGQLKRVKLCTRCARTLTKSA
ncbi:MAG: 50S ribosomal protein L28 [Anaerolineales bacterium]|nr:50S ribosomal protein L28 [Anaerolineales bacterium]